MTGQMKQFLDSTGKLWATNALKDKVTSVFTSTNTQYVSAHLCDSLRLTLHRHGGQESTILSFHTVLLHHGMLIAGLPYEYQYQSDMSEIHGTLAHHASVSSRIAYTHVRAHARARARGARHALFHTVVSCFTFIRLVTLWRFHCRWRRWEAHANKRRARRCRLSGTADCTARSRPQAWEICA